MAAKALEISMLDLQAQMKKGLVKPSELVPKLIAIYRKAAQKGLKESLATFDSYKMRFINSAQDFANVIYRNGLENFARVGLTALKQWLTLLKPIGREIGKVFDGLSDVLYTVQYVVALTMDWMTYLGLLDDKIDETKDSSISLGTVIGWAFGIGILAKFMKGLFGLKWAFGLLIKMFRGPALAQSIAGGLGSAAAEGGLVAGAARSAGTVLGGIFTTAFLAVWGYGIFKAAEWLGAEDIGKKLGNMVADSTVDYPAWYTAMGNTDRAKNVSRWQTGGDAANGWGAGRHVPQQPTKHTIEIEAVVKGDVMTKHIIDQISVVMP